MTADKPRTVALIGIGEAHKISVAEQIRLCGPPLHECVVDPAAEYGAYVRYVQQQYKDWQTPRRCLYCRKEFIPARPAYNYCCPACKHAAKRAASNKQQKGQE